MTWPVAHRSRASSLGSDACSNEVAVSERKLIGSLAQV